MPKLTVKAIAATATKTDAAKIVAHAMGDNIKTGAAQLEAVILRNSASDHDLLNVLRNVETDQKEIRERAIIARWYALDYMKKVEAGTMKEARDQSGNVMIPPLTMVLRASYAAILHGANAKAKSTASGQMQRTVEQDTQYAALRKWWQRKLGEAGIATVSNRGGARLKKAKKAKKAKGAGKSQVDAPKANVVTPVAVTPMEAANYFQREAKAMMAFTSRNKKTAEAFVKLVNDFNLAVSKLGNKLAKSK